MGRTAWLAAGFGLVVVVALLSVWLIIGGPEPQDHNSRPHALASVSPDPNVPLVIRVVVDAHGTARVGGGTARDLSVKDAELVKGDIRDQKALLSRSHDPDRGFVVAVRFTDPDASTWGHLLPILEGAAQAGLADVVLNDVPCRLPEWAREAPEPEVDPNQAQAMAAMERILPLTVANEDDIRTMREHDAAIRNSCVTIECGLKARIPLFLSLLRFFDDSGAKLGLAVGQKGSDAIRVLRVSRSFLTTTTGPATRSSIFDRIRQN